MTHSLGPVRVADGRSGPWAVETFTIGDAEARLFSLRAAMSGNGYQSVHPGTYKRLKHDKRGVVMSNTRMEIITNLEAVRLAKGRVLILGLGLGMVLDAILAKSDVTHVRVVEIDPDVIALVGPAYAGNARVEIVNADAMTYKPHRFEVYDFVWADIWDEISEANLADMATLGRRWNARRAGAFRCWSREIIQRDKRRFR